MGVFLALLIVMMPVLGVGGMAAEEDTPKSPFSSTPWLIVQVVLYLALIVGLIYLTLYVLRKYVYRPPLQGAAQAHLRVLTSVFVAPKKAIYLVKVVDRILVLGATDSGMTTLAEITDPEAIGRLEAALQADSGRSDKTFADYLGMFKRKMGPTANMEIDQEDR